MKSVDKRLSVCTICGKRLSTKTASGKIQWLSSHIDDKGIYCDDCYQAKKVKKK